MESIHKAQFKGLPSNYRKLTKEEIARANSQPAAAAFMPVQEKGIRLANALPYELYAEGLLGDDKQSFDLVLKAGNRIFGNAAAGSPFQVYAPGIYKGEKVNVRDYAVAAGDAISDSWQLQDFEKGIYHLQVYRPQWFLPRVYRQRA